MAATLANGGKNPVTGKQVIDDGQGARASSPSWPPPDSTTTPASGSTTPGLPAKSGVGGGIIAVSPGKFGIAVISPPLDEAGNSVRAQRAIADISNALGGNPYAVPDRRPRHGGAEAELRDLRLRDARHRPRLQADQPELVRHAARHQAAVVRGPVRRGRQHFAGVRQSRLGVRSSTPTALGELKTTFEFELFGTGVDEGQTTFRLRHAYGELGAFGAGQTWSPFMDPDVFPNSLEYWGPTGMVFFRNVQVRWMPIQRATRSLTLALERPGASGDQGVYADRVELQNIRAAVPAARLLRRLQVRRRSWGYVRAAGILRQHQVGRRARRPVRPLRRRHRLGPEPQLEPQGRRERHGPPAVRVRRRHPELHERLAGRHRHRRTTSATR